MRTRTNEELEEIARQMQVVSTRLKLTPIEACTVLQVAMTSALKVACEGDRQVAVRMARGATEIMVQELLRG